MTDSYQQQFDYKRKVLICKLHGKMDIRNNHMYKGTLPNDVGNVMIPARSKIIALRSRDQETLDLFWVPRLAG